MKRIFSLLLIFLTLLVSINFSFAESNKLDWYKNLVPAYWWSFKYNNDLLNLDKSVIILNPNNWEFKSPEPVFIDLIERAKVNDNLVIWYVYTKYWNRNISEVKSNIDNYLKFYWDIDWIFLDEVANNKEDLNFYKEIYKYIKAKNNDLLVFLNPWIIPDKWYLDISDNIVIYENPCNNYKDFFPPIWLKNYSASKFSFLWTSCNEDEYKNLNSKYNNYLTYFTEDWDDWNPWDSFSKYYINKNKEIIKKDNSSWIVLNNVDVNTWIENVNKSNLDINNKNQNQNDILLYIIWFLLIVVIFLLIKKR